MKPSVRQSPGHFRSRPRPAGLSCISLERASHRFVAMIYAGMVVGIGPKLLRSQSALCFPSSSLWHRLSSLILVGVPRFRPRLRSQDLRQRYGNDAYPSAQSMSVKQEVAMSVGKLTLIDCTVVVSRVSG